MCAGSIRCSLKNKLRQLTVLLCAVPLLSQASHIQFEQQRVTEGIRYSIHPAQLKIHHVNQPELNTTLNWLGVQQGDGFVKPKLLGEVKGAHYTAFKRIGLTEWYKPLRGQLEHGITLLDDGYVQTVEDSSHVRRKTVQLRFELKSPMLHWRAEGAQIKRILGVKDHRVMLDYGELVAFDATGQTLPSTMTIHPRKNSTWVDIDVDVTRAEYPVVIDPLFKPDASQAIVPADLKKDDYFARSLATSTTGRWLFVGASPAVHRVNSANVAPPNGGTQSTNHGSTVNGVDAPVRVFKQVQQAGSFTWVKHSDIPAVSDSISARTQFGYAIAQWDEWLAVSAPDYQKNIQFSDGTTRPAQQGAVHFHKLDANQNNGSGKWVFHQTLTYPFVAVADAKMGVRMAFENGVLALSVPFEGDNVGRVLLAVKDAQDHWAYVGASGATPLYGLTAGNDTRCNKDLFGASLAMHHDYLVVGRPLGVEGCNTANKGLLSGSVHVFKKQNTGSSSGQWLEKQVLYPPNKSTAQGYAFGHSVAINGDHLLVGAIYAKNKKSITTGVVYPYELDSNGVWVLRPDPDANSANNTGYKIEPSHGERGMTFGFSLALNGDKALIGATGSGWSGYDGTIGQDANADRVGEVYVYAFSNGAWHQSQVIKSIATTIRGQLFGMTLGWLQNQGVPLIGSPLAVDKNNVRTGYLQQYKPADDVSLSTIQLGASGLSSMVEGTDFDVTITIKNDARLDDSVEHPLFINTHGLPITLTNSPSDFLCDSTQKNGRYACQLPVMTKASKREALFGFKVGAFTTQMNEAIEFSIEPSTNREVVHGVGLSIARNVSLNHPPQTQLLDSEFVNVDYNQLNNTDLLLARTKVKDKDQAKTFCMLNTFQKGFICKPLDENTFGLFLDASQSKALKETNDVFMRFSDGIDIVTEKVTVNVANLPNIETDPVSSGSATSALGLMDLCCLLWLNLLGRTLLKKSAPVNPSSL